MHFLLDTNSFSDLMQSHPRVSARLAGVQSPDRVVICSIVRGEIRYGIDRLPQGRRRHELDDNAADLFAIIPCEPVPEAAGDHFATIKISRERKGLSLNDNDCWIAATALALGAVLVTRDSDFQQIDGLSIEDWSI